MRLIPYFLFLLIIQVSCKILPSSEKKPFARPYNGDVRFLASDSLKGRYPGTPEDKAAATFIRDGFRNAGLRLLGKDGFQSFEVTTGVRLNGTNGLEFAGRQARLKEEFIPLAFSGNGEVSAPVVFAGYGFDLKTDSLTWNDFQDIDVKGKWVLIFRGSPDPDNLKSVYADQGDIRSKVLRAQDHGALGVLVFSGPAFDKQDQLIELLPERSAAPSQIPVLHISRSFANHILKDSGQDSESLESKLNSSRKPYSLLIPAILKASVYLEHTKATTWNIIALAEGSDPLLKDQFVVIGGHYDHLGMGGLSSGSRNPDTLAIHNGADDNASGTGMVMALARHFAAEGKNHGRSLIFVAFGAEELGVLGSKYFVANPPVPREKIVAMVNFDMVGRMNSDQNLVVSGTGTSTAGDSLAKSAGAGLDLTLSLSPGGSGGSDQTSFFLEKIPVFFVSTGGHDDYHRPSDDFDRLNLKGAFKVYQYGKNLVQALSDQKNPPRFVEQKTPESRDSRGGRFKVTLGIMPDFTSTDNKGVRVDMVKAGGPAEKGGMLKGDVIISMDGKEVSNIEEYMVRLKSLKAGTTVEVKVNRGGKTETLTVPL